jgi:4-amino-4-deoxy-L-arabinose transferase-like glycosyltransferase
MPRGLEIALVAGILLGAIFLRVIALRSFPPGFRYDELVNATGVDQVLREGPTIYFTSGWGHEPLFQHVAAVVWLLAGRSAVTFRLTAALFGIMGVLAGWLLARRLFGSWVALLTMAALATTFVPLLFARLALRVIALPLFTSLTAYALWRALDPESDESAGGRPALWFAMGGLTLGLALLTYPAARVLPFMLLAFVIYLAIFHRERLKNRWWGLLLTFGLAALLSGPMFLYLRANPEAEQRYQQLSGLIGTFGQGDVAPLVVGIRKTLAMFIQEGDSEWYYNIADRPFFPLPVAILFFLGLALAIWRWRRPAYALVLLLLLGGLIPGMVSSTNPGFSRTINILPVVYIFPALALVEGATWAARRWNKGRYLIMGAVTALALLYFAADIFAYFGLWTQHPETQMLHGPGTLELAEYLEAHPQIENIAISAPGVNYYDPWDLIQMDLLLSREARIRWFNGANSLIVPATAGPVIYYFRDDAPLNDDWEPLFAGDQAQNAADLDSGELSHFSVRMLQDPNQATKQLLASTVASEPVKFGDLVTFRGQSELESTYLPGQTIRLTTIWQANQVAAEPLIVFVHLLNDQGEWVAGWDKLDVAPEYWGQGDVFALNHELVIPEDARPGVYQVTAGWYSPVTGDRLLAGEGDGQVLLGDIEIGGS